MLTRRTFTSALAAGTATLAKPAIVSASVGRPTNGVRSVEDSAPDAENLSIQYNLAYQRTPKLRALCSDTDSVAATVRWAREEGLSFALRSGGHCFAGSSTHADLVIDLRQMDRVWVDPDSRRLTGQPGAKLGAVYRAGFPHNLTVPAGWCADVGLGGHALGGGIGYLARAHGLLCDHLAALTLVDAEGHIHHVNAQSDSDLLWASRGGGGGLGAVTRYTFDMQSTGTTTSLRLFGGVEAHQAAPLIHRWMDWSIAQPNQTTSHLAVTSLSDGRIFVRITGLSEFSAATLQVSLAPVAEDVLLFIGPSLVEGIYGEVMEETVLSFPAFYLPADARAVFRPSIVPIDALEALIDVQVRAQGDGNAMGMVFETLGGAIDTPAPGATAYPHRGSSFLAWASVSAQDGPGLDLARPFLDEAAIHLRAGASGQGYVNYRDRSLEDFATAYWGENLARLQGVKRRIDPDGLFSSLHTVPL